MALTIAKILEILKEKPVNKTVIPKARYQEDRLRFHSETTIEGDTANRALTYFFQKVSDFLPYEDKYQMFTSIFHYPVCTVSFTDRIYTAIEKLFDGRNPVINYEFSNPTDAEDWQNNRQRLAPMKRWKTEGFEVMKTRINSVMIVDLPTEQTTDQPEPYYYYLPIDHVIDFDGTNISQLDWIMFRLSKDKMAVYDDMSYRVFPLKDGELIPGTSAEIDNPHSLGYCPARFFWTTPLNYRKPWIKKAPISNHLGQLDMLAFFETGNDHLNLYARYPVYSVFNSNCSFQDQDTGMYCDRGLLKNASGYYMIDSAKKAQHCPVCASKRLEGAGSLVKIDPPSLGNNNADLRNPVQVLTIDRNSLDYNNEDIARRKGAIYSSVTGYQGMPVNDQAVNEQQVLAIFESLEAALKTPQLNFEQAIEWVESTICRLRYGTEHFLKMSISLGTEHFLMTPSQIMEIYKFAKLAGFSLQTLDVIEDRYYETEYRNNPEQLQRQRILNNVDPFRHRAIGDVQAMYQAGQIQYEDYLIKSNFSSLIMRFEREFVSVTEFGIGVSFNQRIKSIKKVLTMYAQEMKPVKAPDPVPDPTASTFNKN